jgi:hypothetical protein
MKKLILLTSFLTACGAFGGGGRKTSPVAMESSTVAATSTGGGGYYGPPAGDIAVQPTQAPPVDRPGLGTSWGEQVHAPISFSPFVRATTTPWAEVALHYNDAEGAAAHAAYLGAGATPLEVYAGDGSLGVALVDDTGATLPGFTTGGRAIVVGEDGERYRLVIRNGTSARFEVVASVDGLDVVDGKPADPNRRGYIVDPYDSLVIDGFRTSDDSVAAFRFGAVGESYAAQTSGDRNVGVVGFAIFAEQGATWTPVELARRDTANPFPQRGYAVPPR